MPIPSIKDARKALKLFENLPEEKVKARAIVLEARVLLKKYDINGQKGFLNKLAEGVKTKLKIQQPAPSAAAPQAQVTAIDAVNLSKEEKLILEEIQYLRKKLTEWQTSDETAEVHKGKLLQIAIHEAALAFANAVPHNGGVCAILADEVKEDEKIVTSDGRVWDAVSLIRYITMSGRMRNPEYGSIFAVKDQIEIIRRAQEIRAKLNLTEDEDFFVRHYIPTIDEATTDSDIEAIVNFKGFEKPKLCLINPPLAAYLIRRSLKDTPEKNQQQLMALAKDHAELAKLILGNDKLSDLLLYKDASKCLQDLINHDKKLRPLILIEYPKARKALFPADQEFTPQTQALLITHLTALAVENQDQCGKYLIQLSKGNVQYLKTILSHELLRTLFLHTNAMIEIASVSIQHALTILCDPQILQDKVLSEKGVGGKSFRRDKEFVAYDLWTIVEKSTPPKPQPTESKEEKDEEKITNEEAILRQINPRVSNPRVARFILQNENLRGQFYHYQSEKWFADLVLANISGDTKNDLQFLQGICKDSKAAGIILTEVVPVLRKGMDAQSLNTFTAKVLAQLKLNIKAEDYALLLYTWTKKDIHSVDVVLSEDDIFVDVWKMKTPAEKISQLTIWFGLLKENEGSKQALLLLYVLIPPILLKTPAKKVAAKEFPDDVAVLVATLRNNEDIKAAFIKAISKAPYYQELMHFLAHDYLLEVFITLPPQVLRPLIRELACSSLQGAIFVLKEHPSLGVKMLQGDSHAEKAGKINTLTKIACSSTEAAELIFKDINIAKHLLTDKQTANTALLSIAQSHPKSALYIWNDKTLRNKLDEKNQLDVAALTKTQASPVLAHGIFSGNSNAAPSEQKAEQKQEKDEELETDIFSSALPN